MQQYLQQLQDYWMGIADALGCTHWIIGDYALALDATRVCNFVSQAERTENDVIDSVESIKSNRRTCNKISKANKCTKI